MRSPIDQLSTRYQRVRTDLLADAAATRRGVRKRAVVMVVAGLAAIASMFGMVAANVLAVNFTTTNTKFKVYTNYLEAQQVAGFMTEGTKSSSNEAVADMGIKTLNMAGVCIIAQQALPIPMSFLITAGMPVPDPVANWDSSDPNGSANDAFDNDVLLPSVASKVNSTGQLINPTTDPDITTAQFGFLNSTLLTAYGNDIAGMYLGETADTVNTHAGIGSWPVDNGGKSPAAGDFGIYAQQMNLSGMAGDTFGLNLKGSITLPKLRIRVLAGTKTQADCS